MLAHQAAHPVPAIPELGVHPRAAIALAALGVDRLNLDPEPLILLGAGCCRPRVPRVEAGTGHLQGPAQHPHGIGGLLHRDEGESHSLSLAKKAVAFFKMSRSIRTVRSSRRKRPSSSRSSVVRAPAGPWPASIPACRTQARTALSVRPSSWATTPMDFPLSRINRTVSALNSSVNARRLRLAMEHSYRTFVRSAVSTKPGQLHTYSWRANL